MDRVPPDVADMAREFYEVGRDGQEESIRIRLSAEEKARLKQLAEAAGETQGAYIRRMCGLT